jgi:hypothetical protein
MCYAPYHPQCRYELVPRDRTVIVKVHFAEHLQDLPTRSGIELFILQTQRLTYERTRAHGVEKLSFAYLFVAITIEDAEEIVNNSTEFRPASQIFITRGIPIVLG